MRSCPICGKNYCEHPALSRVDNHTEICPMCGMMEAIVAFRRSFLQEDEVCASNIISSCHVKTVVLLRGEKVDGYISVDLDL